MEQNLSSDLEARKRDHKIMITDEAIEKVPFIRYKAIAEEHYDTIQKLAKDVLKISKEQNNSNEVAIVYSLDWERLAERGQEYIGISLGDEHSINLAEDAVSYHLVHGSFKCVVVCMHNHPNLSKLSLDDVKFFLGNESVKMIAAVTNLGSIFYMIKPDNFDWDSAVDLYNEAISIHNLRPDNLKNAQEAANHFLKNCNQANIIYGYK